MITALLSWTAFACAIASILALTTADLTEVDAGRNPAWAAPLLAVALPILGVTVVVSLWLMVS